MAFLTGHAYGRVCEGMVCSRMLLLSMSTVSSGFENQLGFCRVSNGFRSDFYLFFVCLFLSFFLRFCWVSVGVSIGILLGFYRVSVGFPLVFYSFLLGVIGFLSGFY